MTVTRNFEMTNNKVCEKSNIMENNLYRISYVQNFHDI